MLKAESVTEPQQLIPVLAGSVSPVDNKIAVCCDDGSVRIWDHDKQRYQDPFGGDTWYDHARTCVSWCKDGQSLLTGGEEDFNFDLWSYDGTRLFFFKTSNAFPLLCEMAPDDSVGAFATRNGTVAIRSLSQTLNEREYSRTNHVIESIKFINQNELIVSWEDGVVTLWNWLLGKVLWEYQYHQGPVICMCDSDGQRFASAGKDGFLYVIQTSTGQILASMNFKEPIHLLSWNPKDHFLAVCTSDLLIVDVNTWNIHYRWCLNKPLVFLDFTHKTNTVAGGTSDGQILLLQIQTPA
jgi:WD40 repeat protein